MRDCKHSGLWLRGTGLALMLVAVTSLPAEAHHMMGGGTPSTFMQGLLSGLGHPVIGLDHLAFIVAVGVAAGVAGLNLAVPALFIVASAIGVALHVRGVTLPVAETLVALSVVIAGAMIAWGRSLQVLVWAALFVVAGLVHGYAFGESIYGAEASPLAAYLLGLVIVQAAIATAVALVARRSAAAATEPRLAGAAIAGIGIAILAGQLLPA
ncbi:MAG: urease accessory protein [Alphaproteobacteria bacterium]|jgi:urease accessory protein|nr:urease accessory protein [Alphaproteobacteria bacterium]